MEIEARTTNQWDEKMLRLADAHSPEEIAQILGGILKPRTIASRIAELLKAKNWLTISQQRQLLDWKLRKILNTLEGRFLDLDNAMMQLRLIKEINAQLDKRAAATAVDLNSLYGNQGRIMAEAYDIALTYIQGAFREKIDPDVWAEVKKEALVHAKAELQKHQAIEE